MNSLPFRQIHLDFHTSGSIAGIGSRFSKEQFQEALRLGHVNSITIFSKCHHGWSYHPTRVNRMHPGLSFDLLKAQLEACAETGVRAPVYISAGFDEKEVAAHPEWLNWSSPEGPSKEYLEAAGYHLLCYNTSYLDLLAAQVEEVMEQYHPCEIFLDISDVRICHCPNCRKEILEHGEDPSDPAALRRQGERVYARYCERMEAAVRKYSPDTAIFHNAGNVIRGRRDLAHRNTHHLELESLPTGGWGYDHFPMSAAYARGLGMEFLGMTGKFHTTWGEFGGFKHPNALRYETALSIACGAKCSVGDQLHPTGEMNLSTYRLIGKAYAEIEAKEPWCAGAENIADIGVLSAEAVNGFAGRDCPADTGASRILLEGHYLYDILDLESDFSKYRLLILPDEIRLDDPLANRLNRYLENGGKILATGLSGLKTGAAQFALPFGAEFLGENEFCPSYYIPGFETVNGQTAYVIYQQGYRIRILSGSCFALEQDSYFNRTPEHFSSHQHTPNNPDVSAPGAVLTENTAYLSWKLFQEYANTGSFHVKELLCRAIDALLGESKTLRTNLPDRGVAALTRQPAENRLVQHLLFAYTTNRGQKTEVIQDSIPLFNIHVSVRSETAPKTVTLAPGGEPLPFRFENGMISYTVPKLELHQMTVIQY